LVVAAVNLYLKQGKDGAGSRAGNWEEDILARIVSNAEIAGIFARIKWGNGPVFAPIGSGFGGE
jgi:hypothetical protein